MALRPIYVRQSQLIKDYDKAFANFLKDSEVYQTQLAAFKKTKDSIEPPPTPPIEPVCPRIVVNDSTIEALGKRLCDNPRGVLASYDELAGWLGAFNKYSKGSGDESKWLEFYNAQTAIIDRASAKRPLIVERASVSVFGTIQPAILRKHLTADYKASGLAARLLFAMPPRMPKQWSENDVDENLENQVADIFDTLLSIEMQVDDNESLKPCLVQMDGDSKRSFVEYYNRHNREQQELSEDLYAAYSKLEEVAARLALVIHAVRYALVEVKSLYTIDKTSMDIGISLCEWFKQEARRVYAVLAEDEFAHENRKLIQWIASQGGSVTARELYRGNKGTIGSADEAEATLREFAKSELGTWEPVLPTEAGGRPTQRFVLASQCHNLKKHEENRGYGTEPVNEPPKPSPPPTGLADDEVGF